MTQPILAICILLYLVTSSSSSQAKMLDSIVGIWKSERCKNGAVQTSQYKVVVKGVDAYKAVWWSKDSEDRRHGIAKLTLDSKGNIFKDWENQSGVKMSWVCEGAYELLTGQQDLEWKYFEFEKAANKAETWTSCFEEVSAPPDFLIRKLAKQGIDAEVSRNIEQHNKKIKRTRQEIIEEVGFRPKMPSRSAPKPQAITVREPMPKSVVEDEKKSGYVAKEFDADFPSLGSSPVKASSPGKARVQKSSRLLSQDPVFFSQEEISPSVALEQSTQPESLVDTPRIADIPPPPAHLPPLPSQLPPPPLESPPLPPLPTSPCPPDPKKPKQIESKNWYLKEENILQQGWEKFQTEEGKIWFFNVEENAWFWKLHKVAPVADPKSQQFEEVNLDDGSKMWWNPNTEGFFYAY